MLARVGREYAGAAGWRVASGASCVRLDPFLGVAMKRHQRAWVLRAILDHVKRRSFGTQPAGWGSVHAIVSEILQPGEAGIESASFCRVLITACETREQ